MITKVYTASTLGLSVNLIEVEVDIHPSLPKVVVVGLPDKAVQESKERIRSSFKHSGIEFPLSKVTINLAPADIHKSGSGFDLPMAIGILSLMGVLKNPISKKSLFLGELALDGQLRKVNGVLSILLWAKANSFTEVFVPAKNLAEASLVKGLKIYPVESLKDLIKHLNQEELIPACEPIDLNQLIQASEPRKKTQDGLYYNDLAYIKGQKMAKRALEIAASGGHNVLFIGQPGSGKTMLAKAYATILPQMTEQEIIEVTQIYSLIGKLPTNNIILDRPFRAPHHSASHVSIVGGGSKLRPGEISLAHRGVLFMDEFPEFSRETIEVLRQPLEDGKVSITRASGSVVYPSRFYLMAAANPTPGGFSANDNNFNNKPQSRAAIARYQAKFSGPILDRIDIQVEVNRPEQAELRSTELEEKSETVKLRVQQARDIQNQRFKQEIITTNAEMTSPLIRKYCQIDDKTQQILDMAVKKFDLSARSYNKILKLSRTIADLAGSTNIQTNHLAEALQYRGSWQS